MEHSVEVGGSTAKRVMNCPGSVALCKKMPPRPASSYANEGSLCHLAIDRILTHHENRGYSLIGNLRFEDLVLTQELLENKIHVALDLLEQVDPNNEMEFTTEQRVSFGDLIPGAFGTTDLLGRIGNRVISLDWKFGDGVPVEAEENEQGMFYVAAGRRTPGMEWAYKGATEVEIIIVQPPHIRRWVTDFSRIDVFEQDLICAVAASKKEGAKLQHGDWCRWCAAKPICPVMNGAVDRALRTKIDALDKDQVSQALRLADQLEDWIKDTRALAFEMLKNGATLPDWKLVAKRGTRKWVKPEDAVKMLQEAGVEPFAPQEVISPAVAEKALKKVKKDLPADMVVSVSSGDTLAPADDPRPAIQQIGGILKNALSKLV